MGSQLGNVGRVGHGTSPTFEVILSLRPWKLQACEGRGCWVTLSVLLWLIFLLGNGAVPGGWVQAIRPHTLDLPSRFSQSFNKQVENFAHFKVLLPF